MLKFNKNAAYVCSSVLYSIPYTHTCDHSLTIIRGNHCPCTTSFLIALQSVILIFWKLTWHECDRLSYAQRTLENCTSYAQISTSTYTHSFCAFMCICMCALHVHQPISITPLLLQTTEWSQWSDVRTNSRDNSLDTLASDYNLIQCLKPYINPTSSDSRAVPTTEMPQFLFPIQCSLFLWCDPFYLKDNK